MKIKMIFQAILIVIFCASQVSAQLEILSGPKYGSYYHFVDDMISIVGTSASNPFVNIETSGAGYNFNQITDRQTRFKFAIVQLDYLFLMQAKDYMENTELTKNIKVVFPLATEEIHVVTKMSYDLDSLPDLNSLAVAVGSKNQGSYATAHFMRERSKINWESRYIHFDQALKDLLNDNIHAFIIIGSAPLKKLNIDGSVMVDPLKLLQLQNFNGWADPYNNDTIWQNTYKWLEEDVPTFGVKSVLIVNEAKITSRERDAISNIKNTIEAKSNWLIENGHPKWKEFDLLNWNEKDWPVLK